MSGRSGYNINLGATDNGASAAIDRLGKRIQALTAPADRFNKSMSNFGRVTGIARTAESIKGLGDNALGAARAMERMVSPLGLLTSAASIAGAAELTKRWAEMGNTLGKISYQLAEPVEKVSTLRQAMKLAGGTADSMDAGLQNLNKIMTDVAYGRGGQMTSILSQMGINAGTPGHIASVTDALGPLADFIKSKEGQPQVQQHALDVLGLPADFLPLLKNGRQGLEDFEKQARATGGVMTGQMAAQATELQKSWSRLGEDIDGVVNRLTSKYEPLVNRILTKTSDWIEKNKQTADRLTEIGTAAAALAATKPAAWLLRLLGFASTSAALSTAGAAGAAAGIAYEGFHISPTRSQEDENAVLGGSMAQRFPDLIAGASTAPGLWWNRFSSGYFPSHEGPSASSGPRRGGYHPGVPYQAGSLLEQMTIGQTQYDAYRSAVAGIEHARYDQMGGSSGRFAGRYQMGQQEIAETARRLFERTPTRAQFLADPKMQERYFEAYTAAHDQQLREESPEYRAMSPSERLRVLGYAHNQGVGGAESWLTTGQIGRDAFGTSGTKYYDAVGDELSRAGDQNTAPNGVPRTGPVFGPQGAVDVHVHFHNAPAGTRAEATGTGPVNVRPPLVETSMPMTGP